MPYPAHHTAPAARPRPRGPLPQEGEQADATPTDQQAEEGLPPSLKLLIRVLKANPAALPQLVKACKAALAVVDGQNVPAGAPMTTNEYAEALVLNLVNTDEYPTLTCAELGVNSEYPNDAERLYDLARMAKFAWDHSGVTANSFDGPEERRTFMNLVDVGEVLPPVANQFPADMFPGGKDKHGNRPDYRPDNSRSNQREYRRPFGGRLKGKMGGSFFSECERDDHGWCKPARSVGEHLDSALGEAIEGRIKQAVQDRANEAVHQRLGDHIDQLIEQELLKRMPTGERWTTRTLRRVKQGAKLLFGGVPGVALGAGAGYLGAQAGTALAATGVAGPAGLLGGAVLGGPLGVAGAVGTGALLGGAAGYRAVGPLAAKATKLLGKAARKSPRAVGALTGYLGGKGLRALVHPVGAGAATGAMLAGGVAGTLGAGLTGPVGVGAAAGALGGAYLKRKFGKRAAATQQPATGGPSQRVEEATAARVEAREERRRQGYGTTPPTPHVPDAGMWHPIPKTGIKQAPAPTEPAFAHEPAGSHMGASRGVRPRPSGPPQKPNTNFTKAPDKDIPAFLPEVPEVTKEDLAQATKAAVDATLAAKNEAKRNKSRRRNYTKLHQEASVAHQRVAEAASELGYDELAEAHRKSAAEFRRKAEAHRNKPTTTTNLLVTNSEDEYHLNLLVNALRDPREVRGFLEALDGLDRLLTNSGFNEEDHPRAKDGRWTKAHRAILATRGAIQGAVAGAAGGATMSASAVAAPAVGFAAGALGGAYLGYKLAKKLEKSTSGLHPARQVSRYIGGFYGGGYGTRAGGTLGAGVGTAAGHLSGAALGGLAAGKAGALTGAAIGGPIGAAAGVTGGMLLGTALGSSAGQMASRGVEAVAKVGFKGGKLLWRGIDATAGRSVRSLLQNESSGGLRWVQITNDGGNCGDGPGGFQPGNTCAQGGGGGGTPAPGSNAPHGVLGHVKEFFAAPKAGRRRAADRADRKAQEAEAAGDKAGAAQWRAKAAEHRSHIPAKDQPSTDTTTSHGRPAKVYSATGHDAPPPVKPAKPEGSNRQPSTADDIAHAVAGERRALPAAMVGTMLGGAIAGPLGAAIGMGIPLWGAYHLDKKRRREEAANNSLVWEEVDNRRRGRGSRGGRGGYRGGRGGYHPGNEHRDRDGRFATTEGRDQVEDKTPPRPHGGSGDFHEAMKPGTRYDRATGEYQSTKKAPPAPPSFPGGGAGKGEQEVQYPRRVSEWDSRGKSQLSRLRDDHVDQEDDNDDDEDTDDAARGGLKDHLADNSLTTNCGGNRACGCNTNNGRPSDELDMDPEKACQILKDGKVRNTPLTKKQRGMFGARCSRRDQH